MARISALTPAERDLVSMTVTDAEKGTDGEIVTIVSQRSDQYRDAALHYAVLAMLVVAALAAIWPPLLEAIAYPGAGGWGNAEPARLLFTLAVLEVIAFLAARYALEWSPLRLALTPKSTKARRVRRRAVEYFKVGAERRTTARVGILLYLSLDERIAEIVADEAIHGKVPAERWGEAMAALVERVKEGKPGEGMAAAVTAIGAIVGEHFPKTADDINELPDRLIEL
jgi:putative membrane protein